MEQLRDPERLFDGGGDPRSAELARLARAARLTLEPLPSEPGAGAETACDLFCALAALGRLEAAGLGRLLGEPGWQGSAGPISVLVGAAGAGRARFSDAARRLLECAEPLLGPLAGNAERALSCEELAGRARALLAPEGHGPLFAQAAGPRGALAAPDAPGFAYQHFRAADRARLAGSRDSVAPEELPLFTQTYTERFLVDFLAQNTLGRLHLAARGPSPLLGRLRYFLPPERPGLPGVRAPRVVDPACGGGAMLLGALDLLIAMRLETEGGSVLAAGEAVLAEQLFGLDVDPRAVALARFSLLARLLELGGGDGMGELGGWVGGRGGARLPEPRLAIAASAAERARLAGATGGGARSRPDLEALLAELDGLGSLLDPRAGSGEPPGEGGALDLLGRRYDVVLMNPPFVGFRKLPREHTEMLERACPMAGMDLCGAFLERGLGFLSPSGLLGAVAPASWMTSSRTEPLRAALLAMRPLVSVALGQRAFADAPLLFASLFVACRAPRPPRGEDEPLRVLRCPSPASPRRLEAARRGGGRAYPLELLEELPGLPLLPTAPPSLLEATRRLGRIGDVATLRDGFWSPGSSAALRYFWEIGDRERDTVPVSGGKGYRRWFAADRLRAPRRLVEALRGEPRETGAWEYARVAGGKLSARRATPGSFAIAGVVTLSPRPEGRPSAASSSASSAALSLALVGALMNARLGTALLRTTTSGLNFNPGYCRRLPLPSLPELRASALALEVERAVRASAFEDAEHPTSDAYDPRASRGLGTLGAAVLARRRARLEASARALEAEAEIEAILAEAVGLSAADLDALEADLGLLPGRLPRVAGLRPGIQRKGELSLPDEGAGERALGPLPPASPLEALCRAERLHPRDALPRLLAEPPSRAEVAELIGLELCRMLGFRWPLEPEPALVERGAPFVLLPAADLPSGAPGPEPGARLSRHLADLLSPAEPPAPEAERRIADEARLLLGRSLGAWTRTGFDAWHAGTFSRRPFVVRLASRPAAPAASGGPSRARVRPPALEVLVLLRRFDAAAAGDLAANAMSLAASLAASPSGRGKDERTVELRAFAQALEAFASRLPLASPPGFACDARALTEALEGAALLAAGLPARRGGSGGRKVGPGK